jgi:hypothetical protein
VKLEIKRSAYKHGFNMDDIINAFKTVEVTGKDDLDNIVIIGESTKKGKIEVIYKYVDSKIIVFHCMKARKKFMRNNKRKGL